MDTSPNGYPSQPTLVPSSPSPCIGPFPFPTVSLYLRESRGHTLRSPSGLWPWPDTRDSLLACPSLVTNRLSLLTRIARTHTPVTHPVDSCPGPTRVTLSLPAPPSFTRRSMVLPLCETHPFHGLPPRDRVECQTQCGVPEGPRPHTDSGLPPASTRSPFSFVESAVRP